MNDLNYSSEIKENLERELFLKYTKKLRNIDTEKKQTIMVDFIKKEISLMKENNKKDLWNNWLLIVENELDKEKIELIFLHSVLKTKGFRKFALSNIK